MQPYAIDGPRLQPAPLARTLALATPVDGPDLRRDFEDADPDALAIEVAVHDRAADLALDPSGEQCPKSAGSSALDAAELTRRKGSSFRRSRDAFAHRSPHMCSGRRRRTSSPAFQEGVRTLDRAT